MISSLAKVFKVSVEKGYLPNNWLDLQRVYDKDLLNAVRRHINAHLDGGEFNPEEGCETVARHVEHAAYGLLMIAARLESQKK